MENNVELRKVRDFGELISDSFLFTKQNLKPLLKAFFAICGFFLVATALSSVFYHLRLFNTPGNENIFKAKQVFGVEYFATITFGYLSYLAVALTTFSYINVYREKGDLTPTIEEVWGHFKYYFWRFMGSQIVLIIMFLIAFMMCFIPGIYLFPIISLITATLIFENTGLGYAFDRGFKLIKQNWWTTFGALVVTMVSMYILMAAIALPVGILSGAGVFLGINKVSTPVTVLMVILQALGQAFSIIPYITVSLCYFSLVEKKEGASLLDKIDSIGKGGPADGLPEEQY